MKPLTITLWNIQGIHSSSLGCKTKNLDFKKSVSDTDIIILQETWRRTDEVTLCPPGYREISISSQKHENITCGRDSGGTIIWHKLEIDKYIQLIKKEESHVWLKINNQLSQTTKDIFLCALYIPPSESPYYNENIFETLHSQINHFQALGSVLVCGDFNARTGSLHDYTTDNGNNYIFGQSFQQNSVHLSRNNFDTQVNKNGKLLIELCRSLGIYIINGRMRGDSLGRYTYTSFHGCSTVDYMITDLDPFSLKAFIVKPLTPLSDHSQTTLYLRREENTNIHPQPSKLYNIKKNYRWFRNSTEKYLIANDHPQVHLLLDTFIEKTYSPNADGVNLAVENINDIFDYLATISNLKITKEKNHEPKQEDWFDSDCKRIRKNLRQLANQKHRQPDSADLRLRYCEELKKYKNTLRKKKEQFIQNQLKTIEESIHSNSFWDNWNLLNKNNHEPITIQNGDTWKNHFEQLYCKINMNTEQTQIYEKLKHMECIIGKYQNPLDYPITEKELREKIQNLTAKKSSGLDGILNEMLKNINDKFKLAILNLFNLILSVGYFPDIWNKGLITPIFKSGDKSDPNNYRGICVSSNLGKLFCSIINTRLIHVLTEHNVINKSQIGFLPKYRTSDHIFTLHTLIDKYIHQKKTKIFACFVDFQKAFDSIWHEGLLSKLLESGIGGNVYNIIKTMYLNNKCAIKIGNKQTEYFTQGRGVRQGCPLSPTLFNIYINELAKLLEQTSSPGLTLHDSNIKFLMFADDLVLLSPTQEGLQQSLDTLHKFCQTWALTINTNKTKILIFQKRPRSQRKTHNFTIGATEIDHVTNYTYLGLKISATGNLKLAMNELKEKARRAFYTIKKSIQIEIPIRIWLKIFQSVIEPIALYGSEVWGPLLNHEFNKWDKSPIESLHVEFCRSILRVQRNTPNNACRAELGQYPLLMRIQKRTIKFWKHLKISDPDSYHFKALKHHELNTEKSSMIQMIVKLQNQTNTTNNTQHQDTDSLIHKIHPNQIIKVQKENYLTHWTESTRKQSKLECYLTLDRNYTTAEYLSTVKDCKLRRTMTRYRLNNHTLIIEKGRHRQNWLPKDKRICPYCNRGDIETEQHFLISCPNYEEIRKKFYPRFESICPDFRKLDNNTQLQYLLGEKQDCILLAAQYIHACHNKREESTNQ